LRKATTRINAGHFFNKIRKWCHTYEEKTEIDLLLDIDAIKLPEEMAKLIKIDRKIKRIDSSVVTSIIKR
jgi:hypothetical protein